MYQHVIRFWNTFHCPYVPSSVLYIYICHCLYYTDLAVTVDYLLCVHNCTKCIVGCHVQCVCWPACISRLPIHGLAVPYVFHMLFGCHNFLWQQTSFVFMCRTVRPFLAPPVPCHHTKHLFISMCARTCAFGSCCVHTIYLSDMLPLILSSSLFICL
jgi:hypothetical protein